VTVRYRVPVADPLLEQARSWLPVEGFRLVSVDGPWLEHPDVTICTFEDDGAPAELEGQLVEPVFTADFTAGLPSARVTGRQVITC
jgi:hypothetical protein